ncbi:MAG: hypothetical protein Q9227_009064 [Pyrenula ochraceoflavens]
MLAYVYWRNASNAAHETAINNATNAGTVLGMLLFGVLADIYGRRKLYGYELTVLLIGVMGFIMCSTGYVPLDRVNGKAIEYVDYATFGSMNIQSWFLFWRFIAGIGTGGEFPLSGVIASEFAPTSNRGRILAAVFSGSNFGVAAGATVALVVTKVVLTQHPNVSVGPEVSARAVDQIWRWVIGLGLIPAALTAISRFTIPESPRYTLDVLNDPMKALQETDRLKRSSFGAEIRGQSHRNAMLDRSTSRDDEETANSPSASGQDSGTHRQNPTIKQYFWDEGGWSYLFATSFFWFCGDFSLFAIELNNASELSKFWYGPVDKVKKPKIWNSNTVDPNATIFDVLVQNSVHLLVLELIAAILGSTCLIIFINRVNRKMLAWVMSLVTGLLILLNGIMLLKASVSQFWGINITLHALVKFATSFGPGILPFVLPAELFPTKFRATCFGISAAVGKLGAIVAFVFLRYITFGSGESKITQFGEPETWLAYVFIIFAIPMVLAAFVIWLYIPEIQDKSGKSKTLEELAEGRRVRRPADVEAV